MDQREEHSEMEELDLFDSIVRGSAEKEVVEQFKARLQADEEFAQRFEVFKRTIGHLRENVEGEGDVDTSELKRRLEDEDGGMDLD